MTQAPTTHELTLVEAVRADSQIGRNTCSSTDECLTDSELVDDIRENNLETKDAVLDHFFESENLWRERQDEDLAAHGQKETWGQLTRKGA